MMSIFDAICGAHQRHMMLSGLVSLNRIPNTASSVIFYPRSEICRPWMPISIRTLTGDMRAHLPKDEAFRGPAAERLLAAVTNPTMLANCPENLRGSAGSEGDKDAGADINTQNKRGESALMISMRYCVDAVPFLLERGGNPESRNKAGQTPLDRARIVGNGTLPESMGSRKIDRD